MALLFDRVLTEEALIVQAIGINAYIRLHSMLASSWKGACSQLRDT